MLTSTEHRYFKIIADKINTGDSDAAIASRLGVSRSTVARARDWGSRKGIYETALGEQLLRDIVKWQEHEQELLDEWQAAREILISKKGARRVPIHPVALATYSRELREVRTRLLELTGVYKKTVNIEHTGKDGGDIVVKYELVDSDDAGTD